MLPLLVREDHRAERDRWTDWDPWAELDRLEQRLAGTWRSMRDLLAAEVAQAPAVVDDDDAYVVRMDVPGVRRRDVEVEVAGRRVVVRAERTARRGWLRRRRHVGTYRFDVTLPGPVDPDGATATLDGDVLTVRVAKPAGLRRRHVPVRTQR